MANQDKYVSKNISVKESLIHGLGVFALVDILKDELIEICPIILLDSDDIKKIDETFLYNYYFSWENKQGAISLGWGSLYNHSYTPNAIYQKDFDNKKIIFRAIQDIKSGEEICVNYNGNPDSIKKVWFDK